MLAATDYLDLHCGLQNVCKYTRVDNGGRGEKFDSKCHQNFNWQKDLKFQLTQKNNLKFKLTRPKDLQFKLTRPKVDNSKGDGSTFPPECVPRLDPNIKQIHTDEDDNGLARTQM